MKYKYPRYFIINQNLQDKSWMKDGAWMVYATVKMKNGYIYYLREHDRRFGRGGKEFTDFKAAKESSADYHIRNGRWKEISAAELVLII